MTISPCPNCAGSNLYRSVHTTPATGLFGPNLLPKLPMGRFRVIVCKDCGLTRLFASSINTEALGGPGWERVTDEPSGPLGLTRP